MAIDLNNPNPINPEDIQYETMLKDLQGNILKGHGRDYTVHIFLRFKDDQNAGREWIQKFAEQYVTPADKQLAASKRYSETGTLGDIFCSFFLSASGYRALGFIDGELPGDPKFQAGMKGSQLDLSDPDHHEWEEHYRSDMHVMILLADDAEKSLLYRQARNILYELKNGVAEEVMVEYGEALRNTDDKPVEHFGFVEGVSQPLFLKPDVDRAKEYSGISALDEFTKYDPFAPLRLVLVPDPNGQTADSFGSYLVFRKLEQNVRAFKFAVERIADNLGLKESARDRAGAMVVGRFENGDPLTLKSLQGGEGYTNDFDYADDDGTKCPFHAHIRKANPRGDTVTSSIRYGGGLQLDQERSHRIVRRGITYGKRNVAPWEKPLPEECPSSGVGLFFMCFQADIANQFEHIQKSFCNDADFPRPRTGLDPLIGQGASQYLYNWPLEWGKRGTAEFDFRSYVTLKGGEYFFAPSISFLKNIVSLSYDRSRPSPRRY